MLLFSRSGLLSGKSRGRVHVKRSQDQSGQCEGAMQVLQRGKRPLGSNIGQFLYGTRI